MQIKFYFLRETVTFSQYQGMSTSHIGDSSALFVIILVDLNILALVYRYFFSRSKGSLSRNPISAYECDTITNNAHSKCNMSKLLFLNVS